MHDIGKISVSDDILNKPSGLSDKEMTIMREHTLVGYNLLNKSDRPLIKMAALIALEHHEYWNGSGYPKGIAGEAISFAGRVVCLCDVFDALSSLRPYKEAWELPRILDYLRAERGQMFDPELVDALFFHLDEFLAIAKSLKDED
jgi:response regulator RpfG family c-di-GMP phosphodiesterase